MENISVDLMGSSHQYKIEIGYQSLGNCGIWAKKHLPRAAKKVVVISNEKVYRLYGGIVKESLEAENFEVFIHKMGDGERFKNLRSLENALKFLGENKIKRTDAVIALGGGVVGDLSGFAASIYLRGIAFLQIPTTLLAMIDSSVGGKTAVNTPFGKNLIGSFYQPDGVLIDVLTLETLPRRELTAGFCEAIKQGAIADTDLFARTAIFLKKYSVKNFKSYFQLVEFTASLEQLLAAQIAFKAAVVMQDEKESADRTDAKSRKILNFGHTLAHALEKITNYKRFKHGEAVGYGILFAAELSKKLEILDKNELNLLNDVVRNVGTLPDTTNIDSDEIIEAFAFDKKSIGNSLQFILLQGIGKPFIVNSTDIPASAIQESLTSILHK